MPTYDYVCDACGHEMEAFQRFSEEALDTCPSCHAPKLRRLFGSGGGILFKGSGFYETDYRSESYKSAAEKEAGASSSPAASPKASEAKSSETKGSAQNGSEQKGSQGKGSKGKASA
ncbi:MAG: FmdB family transcriptional regulator [Planctomycetota bacterium]|nr:MAG: FmdB family transcriptional regulator [Planctomycetota bacterium]